MNDAVAKVGGKTSRGFGPRVTKQIDWPGR
jgi:hypothetical protein